MAEEGERAHRTPAPSHNAYGRLEGEKKKMQAPPSPHMRSQIQAYTRVRRQREHTSIATCQAPHR